MMPVRLEPAALRSRVKHSTTEPLRSQSTGCDEMGDYFTIEADTMIDIVRVT